MIRAMMIPKVVTTQPPSGPNIIFQDTFTVNDDYLEAFPADIGGYWVDPNENSFIYSEDHALRAEGGTFNNGMNLITSVMPAYNNFEFAVRGIIIPASTTNYIFRFGYTQNLGTITTTARRFQIARTAQFLYEGNTSKASLGFGGAPLEGQTRPNARLRFKCIGTKITVALQGLNPSAADLTLYETSYTFPTLPAWTIGMFYVQSSDIYGRLMEVVMCDNPSPTEWLL